VTYRPTVAGAAAAAAMLLLAACADDASTPRRAAAAPATAPRAAAPISRRPGAERAREDCSTRSGASFPAAFSNPDNAVVGPLVLAGAAHTPADVVREFGGDKIMALVLAGHRVRLALPRRARPGAGLGYGPLPEGVELSPRDGHRVVTFVACRPGIPSGSDVDGRPVTFWSGFVLVSSPRCVPVDVWVDAEPTPRRIALPMGVGRCHEPASAARNPSRQVG